MRARESERRERKGEFVIFVYLQKDKGEEYKGIFTDKGIKPVR
jgi:hypothetical protein